MGEEYHDDSELVAGSIDPELGVCRAAVLEEEGEEDLVSLVIEVARQPKKEHR